MKVKTLSIKGITVSKSDKVKLTLLIGTVIGIISMVIYNSIVNGTVMYFSV